MSPYYLSYSYSYSESHFYFLREISVFLGSSLRRGIAGYPQLNLTSVLPAGLFCFSERSSTPPVTRASPRVSSNASCFRPVSNEKLKINNIQSIVLPCQLDPQSTEYHSAGSAHPPLLSHETANIFFLDSSLLLLSAHREFLHCPIRPIIPSFCNILQLSLAVAHVHSSTT